MRSSRHNGKRLPREVVDDLAHFLRVVNTDTVRFTFYINEKSDAIIMRPRLFGLKYDDNIIVWEGSAAVFPVYDEEAIKQYQKRAYEEVSEKLGFKPIRGRWEW